MISADTERFMRGVLVERDGCWSWTKAKSTSGYGRFWLNGALHQAHRVAYELFRGAIPEGLQLDHLCRNRACVNPAHVEPVTQRINLLRGTGWSARNAAKTRCVRGHEFTEENTRWVTPTKRRCRECERIHVRAQRAAA